MRFLTFIFPITFSLLTMKPFFLDGELKLIPDVINLGKIKSGEIKPYFFVIKNSTNKSITIKNIVGDCGCLNFYWKKKFLKSNETDTIHGTIRVTDTARFNKTIMIYSNAKNSFLTGTITGEGVLL